MWDHMWNGPMMGPWGFAMGIFWLVLFGLVVFLAVYLARQSGAGLQRAGGPRGAGPEPKESPREILDRRDAEGELSREEYDQMKADLEE